MSDIQEIIKETIEGIKSFADAGAVVGDSVNTSSGVTIIPISKLTVTFIGAGIDYGQKKLTQNQSFGGGSGTGVSISPVAFITVTSDCQVNVIQLNNKKNGQDRLTSILEKTPDIIKKIKSNMQ